MEGIRNTKINKNPYHRIEKIRIPKLVKKAQHGKIENVAGSV
jgi:hypothetical protein